MKKYLIIFGCLLSLQIAAQPLPRVAPGQGGLDPRRMQIADELIMQSIADNETPGAVLAVVHKGRMAYLKAYGNRQTYPSALPMEVNTIFDLASVSKSVATGISTMILVERGQLRLTDRVNMYIPNFQGNARVLDLLTHTSGLPSYANVDSMRRRFDFPNPDGLIEFIATCNRLFDPGVRFLYGCLNYIALQRIIETVSGQKLEDFARENIFNVLGMNSTTFRPTGALLPRVAPTERQPDGSVLRGVVHDPLARLINAGNSGNAGLFSDAEDLAILAVALMNGGIYNGKRFMSPLGVRVMTTIPESLAHVGRSPGWDVVSAYASNKGDLLGPNTYGHTGYTGTSMVIDPDNEIAVILLANRVHPEDTSSVVRLRALVANVVAASFDSVN